MLTTGLGRKKKSRSQSVCARVLGSWIIFLFLDFVIMINLAFRVEKILIFVGYKRLEDCGIFVLFCFPSELPV